MSTQHWLSDLVYIQGQLSIPWETMSLLKVSRRYQQAFCAFLPPDDNVKESQAPRSVPGTKPLG